MGIFIHRFGLNVPAFSQSFLGRDSISLKDDTIKLDSPGLFVCGRESGTSFPEGFILANQYPATAAKLVSNMRFLLINISFVLEMKGLFIFYL